MVDGPEDRPTASAVKKQPSDPSPPKASAQPVDKKAIDAKKEIGGPKGPEPTRYGDWEKGGRCIDF